MLELTIVILCLDEEASIGHCLGEAGGFPERHAISGLVVDNASRDRSAVLAEEAGGRVVLEPRRGYGNAVVARIEAARGRSVILEDGAGERDLSSLEPFWENLRACHDFVFGTACPSGNGCYRSWGGVDLARSRS